MSADENVIKKVFNDPIHGHIELHPILVKIIDTPQFQRLRNIKQLGGAYFVYPGASHNRFEHSIGVCYLAGQLVETLRSRQPELQITPQDVLCVQIAGLCHDLGHGPFSHLFDGMFISKVCETEGQQSEQWKHETASVQMFDHMVKSNNLEEEMQKYKLNMQEDQVFIKEMIEGPLETEENPWPYEGRGEDKSFLYEIVSNKENGVDVDKFDYLARDCYHLGIRNNFDHHRFLMYARVCEVKNEEDESKSYHICTRDKMVDDMYDLFNTRYRLHRRVCYHRVTNIIQIMIRDAFLMADKHLQIEGSGGKTFTLSTARKDMEAYIQLTDTVFEKTLHSKDPNLENAKEVLQRIISRDLYKLLGEKRRGRDENENEWKTELTRELPEGLEPEDFEVMPITYDYGMGEDDPFDSIYFYTKKDNKVASIMPREKRPKLVTNEFSEKVIRFYFKKTDEESLTSAEERFDEWNE